VSSINADPQDLNSCRMEIEADNRATIGCVLANSAVNGGLAEPKTASVLHVHMRRNTALPTSHKIQQCVERSDRAHERLPPTEITQWDRRGLVKRCVTGGIGLQPLPNCLGVITSVPSISAPEA
jgi:hypothetical protein